MFSNEIGHLKLSVSFLFAIFDKYEITSEWNDFIGSILSDARFTIIYFSVSRNWCFRL